MVFAVSVTAAFAFVMVVVAGEVGICCECSRGKVFRDFFNVSLRAADYADADVRQRVYRAAADSAADEQFNVCLF